MELGRWFGNTNKPNGKTFCSFHCYKQSLKYTKNTNFKHGKSATRLYNIWDGMKQRCNNKNHPNYKRYGGRGIKVCIEWNNNFESFYHWAKKFRNNRPLTLDRINNNKEYSPENCRWATNVVQSNNMRSNIFYNAFGEKKTIREWSKDKRCHTTFSSLLWRFGSGWPINIAITAPKHSKRCKVT